MRFSNIGFILKKEEYKFNSGFMKSFSSFFILLKSFFEARYSDIYLSNFVHGYDDSGEKDW